MALGVVGVMPLPIRSAVSGRPQQALGGLLPGPGEDYAQIAAAESALCREVSTGFAPICIEVRRTSPHVHTAARHPVGAADGLGSARPDSTDWSGAEPSRSRRSAGRS